MRNPWCCLAAYEEPKEGQDSNKFCGRFNESRELASLIANNLLVTLYGRTGIGKTSLLNAGVFPLLKRDGYFPIVVRFNKKSDLSFAEIITDAINKTGIKVDKTEAPDPKAWIEDEHNDNHKTLIPNINYLWQYFASRHFYNDGKKVFPVVVLDQFEECLIDPVLRDKCETLLLQIYALISDNMIFSGGYHSETNFRFVVSIREDDLFRLEDSIDTLHLPDFKNNRYRLSYLSDKDAKDIICIPGEEILPENEATKEAIIAKIIALARKDSDGINTLLLSLICSCLFDKCIVRSDKKIKESDISDLGGNQDNLLSDFYTKLPISKKTRQILEKEFVDKTGRRKVVNPSDLDIPKDQLKNLKEGSSRILQETNGRLELVHDMLANAIYEVKQQSKKRNFGKIFRVSLLVFFLLIFVSGLFGSIYTLDKMSRIKIPLFPQKEIHVSRGISGLIHSYNYLENVIFERNFTEVIDISSNKKLTSIIVHGNVKAIKIYSCPELREITFADSCKVGDISIHDCPRLRQLLLSKCDSIGDISIENNDSTKFRLLTLPTKFGEISINNESATIVTDDFRGAMWAWPKSKRDLYKWQNGLLIGKGHDSLRVVQVDKNISNLDLSGKKTDLSVLKNCNNLEKITIDATSILDRTANDFRLPSLNEVILKQENNQDKYNPDKLVENIGNLAWITDSLRLTIAANDTLKNGPLNKTKDGILLLNRDTVWISVESSINVIHSPRKLRTKKFIIDQINSNGYSLIGDISSINSGLKLNSLTVTDYKQNTIIGDRIILDDSFIVGFLPRGYIIYCVNLTEKPRRFDIDPDNVCFLNIDDKVKQAIEISVPYGTLDAALEKNNFDGFKNIHEMSILETLAFNCKVYFFGASNFIKSFSLTIKLLSITGILLVFIIILYLNWKNLSGYKPIKRLIRSILGTLGIALVGLFVWVGTYWFLWFWFYEKNSNNEVPSLIASIMTLIAIFAVYKNALFHLWKHRDMLKPAEIKSDLIKLRKVILIHKNQTIVCSLIGLTIIAISTTVYNHSAKIKHAKHIFEMAKADLNGDDDSKKAALFVLASSLKNGDIPASSIRDSIYHLVDSLSFLLGYNLQRLDSLSSSTSDFAINPKSGILLSTHNDSTIRLWNTANNQLKSVIRLTETAGYVRWINDSNFIAYDSDKIILGNINDTISKDRLCHVMYTPECIGNTVYYVPSRWSKSKTIMSISVKNDKFCNPDSITTGESSIYQIVKIGNKLAFGTYNDSVSVIDVMKRVVSPPQYIKGNRLVVSTNDKLYSLHSYQDSIYILDTNLNIKKSIEIKNLIPWYNPENNSIIINNKNNYETISLDYIGGDKPLSECEKVRILAPSSIINYSSGNQWTGNSIKNTYYFIDNDGHIVVIPAEKPSMDKLLHIILSNFASKNYKLDKYEKEKYHLD